MKKYNYNSKIKDLPKKYQDDIYKYIKEGYTLGDCHTPKDERIGKKELIAHYRITDIEEIYPVDTLVQELNK